VRAVTTLLVDIPDINGEHLENNYQNFQQLTALLTNMVGS
jgi:hypothetical protein